MKKLILAIDDLRVESFDTTAARRAPRGTVLGAAIPADTSVCEEDPQDTYGDCTYTCTLDTGWQQCGYSYGGTCGASPPISVFEPCGEDGVLGFIPPDCV